MRPSVADAVADIALPVGALVAALLLFGLFVWLGGVSPVETWVLLFKGPLKDNKGATIIPAGKAYPQTDLELEKMNYLVEGVIGSAG